MGIAQFFGLFKDPIAQEVLEIIKQDWKHLVVVEIEGLKDPSATEGYARWRDLAALAMGQNKEKENASNRGTDGFLSLIHRAFGSHTSFRHCERNKREEKGEAGDGETSRSKRRRTFKFTSTSASVSLFLPSSTSS
jgi:hypothetical protein